MYYVYEGAIDPSPSMMFLQNLEKNIPDLKWTLFMLYRLVNVPNHLVNYRNMPAACHLNLDHLKARQYYYPTILLLWCGYYMGSL